MTDMSTTLPEGRTATSKDGQKRMIVRGGVWTTDDSYRPPAKREKTATQDRQALQAASSKAAAERDALRTYSDAAKAVDGMAWGTGPVTAKWLDVITPDEDGSGGFFGGLADMAGVAIGTPFRPLVSRETWAARDHLKTINANVALAGSQQMKGSSSDKDTALMRMSGIGPYKHADENRRIIKDATYRSGLEQTRALIASKWIAKYGSLSAASPSGMTYEQGLQMGEKKYAELQQASAARRRKGLPKPPPSARRGRTQTIDLDGNPVD